jgi:pyruvate formate lyase activating enzyme
VAILVNSIETFGALDGPGLRTVIFLQRCSLRCKFCHNVECLARDGGKEYSTQELFDLIISNKAYFGEYIEGQEIKGGVTFSGGEPMLQADELIELLTRLKAEKIHITFDTSLFTSNLNIAKLIPLVDYWMVSIKHMDTEKHKNLTGFRNERILENIHLLDNLLSKTTSDEKLRIRFLIIPTLTDGDENIQAMIEFIKRLKNFDFVELLAYNSQAKDKWYKLVGKYELEGVPDANETHLKAVSQKFVDNGIKVIF